MQPLLLEPECVCGGQASVPWAAASRTWLYNGQHLAWGREGVPESSTLGPSTTAGVRTLPCRASWRRVFGTLPAAGLRGCGHQAFQPVITSPTARLSTRGGLR